MKYIFNKYVILREGLYKAKVDKKIENTNKWLVSYYDINNKFKWKIITEDDIMEEEEYLKIKERHNKINKILE